MTKEQNERMVRAAEGANRLHAREIALIERRDCDGGAKPSLITRLDRGLAVLVASLPISV
jgi:hypothetical protein